MARRPKLGKCVHCLKDPVERNWDHVFPVSWYPDTTPRNLSKWKIPSCISCNHSLGELEQKFFVLVAKCLDPHDPASSSIVAKAKRATNPEAAKTNADRAARQRLRDYVESQKHPASAVPMTAIYPTLGNRWGLPIEQQQAISIPAEGFRRITEKIARGIFYLEDGRYIESPYSIQFFALNDAGAQPVRELITRFGATYAREPGIVVRRAVTPEDGISSVFEMEFWGQFKTHAAITSNL